MPVVKKTVSLEEIKSLLAQGKSRKEIAQYYELPLSAMKGVFSHPELKNKKAKKLYEVTLVEEIEVTNAEQISEEPVAETAQRTIFDEIEERQEESFETEQEQAPEIQDESWV